jgi:hypothetical protein
MYQELPRWRFIIAARLQTRLCADEEQGSVGPWIANAAYFQQSCSFAVASATLVEQAVGGRLMPFGARVKTDDLGEATSDRNCGAFAVFLRIHLDRGEAISHSATD